MRRPELAMMLAAAGLGVGAAFAQTSGSVGPPGFARWAVAADVPAASEAGARVLREGGNAADAAAATMLALGVVNPASSGLGGGGFALYYRARDHSVTFLDFRERAPAAATPHMFEHAGELASRVGGLSVAVPGEPAGIDLLLRRFGRIARRNVFAPAIALARRGPPATDYLAHLSPSVASSAMLDPVLGSWYSPSTRQIAPGTLLSSRALAHTLSALARTSAGAFYRGSIAAEIVDRVHGAGGVLTTRDLSAYEAVERAPIEADRFGKRIFSAPPPSVGGYLLLLSLGIVEAAEHRSSARDRSSARGAVAMIESWRLAFADRAAAFGDPDFTHVPLDALLAPTRIAELAGALPAGPPAAAPTAPATREGGTSHLCVVDSEGNVASVTTTVNLVFGSSLTAAGIVLNDEMDDFATAVGAHNAFGLTGGAENLPGPEHRPLSSMTPTIVLDGDRPFACLGGSGGPRIPTAVSQVLRAILAGEDPRTAVAAPRIHHQGDHNIVEVDAGQDTLAQELRSRGYDVQVGPVRVQVQAIVVGPPHLAASDPRKGGAPAGD